MGKVQKQSGAAKVYSLPADYLRRCRYTEFLEKRSKGRILICWYIGADTGRLIGVYWQPSEAYPEMDGYIIAEDDSLQFDESAEYYNWDELLVQLRRAPEQFCADYLPYCMGVISNPPGRKDKGKIIPFRKAA